MLKMMVKTMENVSTIQASILWPKLCQKIHFSDWKSMLKRQKIVWKAPSWPKISEFLKIQLWVQFSMRADGFQDRLSGFPANPGRAGHPQNLKTDVRDLERIWANLSGSAVILGIIRSWQLPLALRLPNPLTTRKLVDCQSEVVPTRSTAGGSADKLSMI